MKRQTIYISGKITGTNDYQFRFACAEGKLRALGWRVINPARKNAHFDPQTTPWEKYMKASIRMLTRCDAIYMLHGWRNSKGAVIEYRLAVDLNLTIIEEGKGDKND